MVLTLDPNPALDVRLDTPPRWGRVQGGRALAHVNYRRRLVRALGGTVGAALVTAAIVFGDGRDLYGGLPRVNDLGNEASRIAASSIRSVGDVVLSTWDDARAWAFVTGRTARSAEATGRLGSSTASGARAAAPADALPAVVAPGLRTSEVDVGTATPTSRVASTPAVPTSAPSTLILPATPQITATAASSAGVIGRTPNSTPLAMVTSTPSTARSDVTRPVATAIRALGPVTYQIVDGDTLWGIAIRFDTSVDAIIRANRLLDADAISPGGRLVIPR